MKKTLSFVLAFAMLLSLLALSGCNNQPSVSDPEDPAGAGDTSNAAGTVAQSKDSIKDLVTYLTTDMKTFNYLESNASRELVIFANCIDSLLTNNKYGDLVPCLAESWGTTDNGKTWTFVIRQGATWVDYEGNYKADVVAEDWLYSLEYVLNYWKNEGNNTGSLINVLAGAEEYYNYTKNMDTDEAKQLDLSVFLDTVSVEAPDSHTLVFTCTEEIPYFDTLTTSQCMYPVSGKLLDELGSAEAFKAVDLTQLWYCGPYLFSEFVPNNERVLTKNDSWWNTEEYVFDTVTIKNIESADVAYQMYTTGELDNVTLSEATIQTISSSSSNQYNGYMVSKDSSNASYIIHYNWNKNNTDDTPDTDYNLAVANEAFRLSLYYGVDFTEYLSRVNAVDPLQTMFQSITCKGLVTASDGRDYVDLVNELTGLTNDNPERFDRYDADKAAAYKEQAIEELTALGVSFPINLAYYVGASEQTELDNARVLEKLFEQGLGSDYIDFEIRTYVSSFSQEARLPGYHSLVLRGNGVGMGDPIDYLNELTADYTNAHYSYDYGLLGNCTQQAVWDTFNAITEKIRSAAAITNDMDARYQAFAEAEAFALNKGIDLPIYTSYTVQLTNINDFSKPHAAYGNSPYRYVGLETNMNGYSEEDWDRLEAEYDAAKAAYYANK